MEEEYKGATVEMLWWKSRGGKCGDVSLPWCGHPVGGIGTCVQ
jgi:hypothetical protein